MLGAEAFTNAPLFAVDYFKDDHLGVVAKKSVAPMIDFDLGTERGTGSPDASAGIPEKNFSVRWVGTVQPPAKGTYTFYADGDNQVNLYVNSQPVLSKKTPGRETVSANVDLPDSRPVQVRVEYIHASGEPSLHVSWAGPSLAHQVMIPTNNASIP